MTKNWKELAKKLLDDMPLNQYAVLIMRTQLTPFLEFFYQHEVSFIDDYTQVSSIDNRIFRRQTAAEVAAEQGNDVFFEFMISKGINFDKYAPNYCDIAIQQDHLNIIKLFHQRGIYLGGSNARGESLAHRAAMRGKLSALELLHELKIMRDEQNPILIALNQGLSSASMAAKRSNTDCLTYILEHYPEQLDLEKSGAMMVHTAVHDNNITVLKLLNTFKFDFNAFAASRYGKITNSLTPICCEETLGFLLQVSICRRMKLVIALKSLIKCVDTLGPNDVNPREYVLAALATKRGCEITEGEDNVILFPHEIANIIGNTHLAKIMLEHPNYQLEVLNDMPGCTDDMLGNSTAVNRNQLFQPLRSTVALSEEHVSVCESKP
ncbi:MAG: hypothetical protein ACRC0M_02060 [Legionella sp.]